MKKVLYSHFFSGITTYLLIVVFFVTTPFFQTQSAAEDASDIDSLLDSFEKSAVPPSTNHEIEANGAEKKDAWFKIPGDVDGYLKLGITDNISHNSPDPGDTDWRGLSSLKTEIHLEYNGQNEKIKWHIGGKASYDAAFRIKGRTEYTKDVLDTYESDYDLEKIYMTGMLTDSLGLTLGRQIVVWGKSDNIRVTDVLNPLDIREYGYADMEDIRLPVTMVRFDLSFQRLNLSAMILPEIRFNDSFPFGSDYYPFETPPPREDIPADRISNAEYALAVNGYFSGWDLSLYYADIYNDTAHLELDPLTSQPILKHARLTMLGSSVNAAHGDWVFKCEGAFFSGLHYFNVPDHSFSRTDVLVGFDYSGLSDTTLTLESAYRRIARFRSAIGKTPDNAEKNLLETIVRFHRTWLNDTLSMTCLATWFGEKTEKGAYYRVSGEYDLSDNLEISLGIISYRKGDLPLFKEIGQNDRLYGQIKYTF